MQYKDALSDLLDDVKTANAQTKQLSNEVEARLAEIGKVVDQRLKEEDQALADAEALRTKGQFEEAAKALDKVQHVKLQEKQALL
jgi:transposase